MTTFAAILLYALGVFIAYIILQEWNRDDLEHPEDYQNLFVFSLLSWGAFLVYGIIYLLNDSDNS